MTEILDPATMTVEQLREEVQYWREHMAATAQAWAHNAAWIAREHGEARRKVRRDVALLNPPDRLAREFTSILADALVGDLFQPCEACDKPVRPGDLVIQDAECGEIHAACMTDDPAVLVDGGFMPVPLEELDIADGAEPPDPPGVRVFRSSRLYDLTRLAKIAGLTEETQA